MATAEQLITENLDIWTSAVKTKSAAGRGSANKLELYGIKKLRELILELAVRGLLVPQDHDDEPASELLKRIAAEKGQLVKAKKIKKKKPLPPVGQNEESFELPPNWEWSRLGDVCMKVTDGSHNPPPDAGSGYPMLSSQNVNYGRIDFSSPSRYVTEDNFLSEDQRTSIQPNDVLLNIVASIGRSAVVPMDAPKFVLQRSVAVLTSGLDPYFLTKMLVSPLCLAYYDNHAKGTAQKGVYLGKLALMPLAVPPLVEQTRIVAKVDELMALCDQLEQQQEASITAHQTLVQTLLDALTTASERDNFTAAWARIADHFDTLFTTEWSIDQLKQTILQLAVMGKLVPQDPNDEPASELLKKIAAKKERLVKDGKIKKQKVLPPITEDEKPFDLPESWVLERVGNLTEKLGSGSTPRGGNNAYVDSGIPFLRSQNVWNDGLRLDDIAYIPPETHDKMSNTKVYPGDVLLNITGASLGRSTIFPRDIDEGNVSQHVTIVRLIEPAMSRFVHLGILSPMIQQLVWGRQVGMAIEGLSKKVFENFEFPIPPLEEQARIVAKVDELLALCDLLITRLNTAQTTQLQLADVIASQALVYRE